MSSDLLVPMDEVEGEVVMDEVAPSIAPADTGTSSSPDGLAETRTPTRTEIDYGTSTRITFMATARSSWGN